MGLRCASCGYDNDPTRVYCHSCGTKLERGGATVPPPTGFTHPTDVAKMKRPRQALPWGRYIGFVLKLGFLAALIAVLVLVLLPPANVPAPVAADEGLAERLSGLVGDASRADSGRSFAVPSTDLQRWLSTAVKFKGSSGVVALDARRVYLVPGDGKFRLGLELGLPASYSVFMEGEYLPVRESAGYSLQPLGYSIGRLPLPVALGYPVVKQFDGLRDALSIQLGQLAKASFIGIDPDSVSLRWSGAANP